MSTMRQIFTDVASEYGLKLEDMRSRDRTYRTAHVRQEGMSRAHRAGFSTTQIGNFLKRDHSTVVDGIKAYKLRLTSLAKCVNSGFAQEDSTMSDNRTTYQAEVRFEDDSMVLEFRLYDYGDYYTDAKLSAIYLFGVDVSYTEFPKEVLEKMQGMAGYISGDDWVAV